MKVSRDQRARLFNGDYGPLTLQGRGKGGKLPPAKRGDRYVLSSSKARTIESEGHTSHYPAEPLFWIEAESVFPKALEDGLWSVRFNVVDRRDPSRYLRSAPPVYDAELMRRDRERGPTEGEIRRAAEESAYTSNVASASDPLPATPRQYTPPDNAALHRKQKVVLAQDERNRLSLGGQVDSVLADARQSRRDTRDRERRIEREVEKLRAELEDEAA